MPLTAVAKPVVTAPVEQRSASTAPIAVLHFNAFDRFISFLFSSHVKPPRKKIVKTFSPG